MLPSNPILHYKWVKVCTSGAFKVNIHSRVCSQHFSPDCYQRDLQHELLGLPLRKRLKPDAVPNMNLDRKRTDTLGVRSSVRIAKKKSLDYLNTTSFTKKLKFMSVLELKPQKAPISLPTYDLGLSLDKIRQYQTER